MLKVDGIQRFVPAAETVASAASIAESLGVTRVADITGLDCISIPVSLMPMPVKPQRREALRDSVEKVPLLSPLYADPQFQSLLKQMNLQ